MTELVFLNPNKTDEIPFTTSDVIAEQAVISYRSVQRLVEKHEKALTAFGRVRFQITPFETKGGVQNKKTKIRVQQTRARRTDCHPHCRCTQCR